MENYLHVIGTIRNLRALLETLLYFAYQVWHNERERYSLSDCYKEWCVPYQIPVGEEIVAPPVYLDF